MKSHFLKLSSRIPFRKTSSEIKQQMPETTSKHVLKAEAANSEELSNYEFFQTKFICK